MDRKRNLLPEYVWMIFVGFLLAIIILMHITPGHADDSSSPSATPIPTSALDPTDACLVVGIHESDYMLFTLSGAEISSLSISELYEQAYFVRYGSAGDSTLFLRDVKIALTQLKSQFQGFFVSILDFGASLNAFNAMYSSISEVGVPISLGYTDFSQNRVLQMVNTNFINAPVWVWNSNIPTPTPSPIPPEPEILSFVFYAGSSYYLVDTYASLSLGLELSSSYQPFVYVRNKYSYFGDLPLLRPSLVYCSSSSSNISLYFPGSSVSDVRIYNIGSTLVSDFDYVRQNFTYTSMSSSGYYGDFQFFLDSSDQGSFTFYSVGIRKGSWSQNPSLASAPGIAQYSFSSSPYNAFYGLYYDSSYSDYCPVVYGIELMVDLRSDPNLPEPTPTYAPSPSPEPLPTSGESIHVILPSGTPTPTPPFTIQPGEGGGNGSPGSFGGTGLSSGETSGILQAFSMYVSDNPVFVFLGGLFSAFPAELMYPLYILLFILIILGIIRVFIHFTGG